MKTQSSLIFAGIFAAATLLALHQAGACTGIALKAKNGDVVCGRTMEWGSFDINSNVLVIPRGEKFSATVNVPEPFKWTGVYGVVGFSAFGTSYLADGANEKGLVVGGFYHPGYAQYAKLSPENSARAISPDDVILYLLSTSKNVDDACANLRKISVVNEVDKNLGIVIPIHLMLTEPSGRQVVVEWSGGEPKLFAADDTRVITNSPEYSWHVTNLSNFLNLQPVASVPRKFDELTIAPLGGGSGMLGLPGDFTPPSRFVRAFTFTKTARPLPDGAEAVYELFRILDNFNLPLGSAEGAGAERLKGLRSSTAWTSGYDLANRKLYYHTQHDRQLQLVDIGRINFDKLDKTITIPLGNKFQSFKDKTPEI